MNGLVALGPADSKLLSMFLLRALESLFMTRPGSIKKRGISGEVLTWV